MAKTRKKANGEGSIVFDKARKRWRGYIPIGYDSITGSVKRKTFSAATKLEVVEMMEDFKRQLNVSPLMIENASTTIKEWMEVFLKDYKKDSMKIRANTLYNYESYCINHIYPHIGDVAIEKLTKTDVQRLYNHLSKNGRVDGKED